MRITSFRAQGYRSLRDVEILELGKFNIFYGPNGAGKSNILAAMRTMLALLEARANPDVRFRNLDQPYSNDRTRAMLRLRDRCQLDPTDDLMLGMSVTWDPDELLVHADMARFSSLAVGVAYSWEMKNMRITRLELDGVSIVPSGGDVHDANPESDDYWHQLRDLVREIARRAYGLVPAERSPRPEKLEARRINLRDLLSRGRIKEAFFRASNHPEALIRHRYKQLQNLLTGPPFCRPPFVVTHDPDNGRLEIVEEQAESPYHVFEVPLDLAGLGIAQVYSIVAQVLLPGMRAVGIEEPEAHLHAPTSGLHLRELLERMVNEGLIDQLFIATHSNLFDLDETGYYDVSFDPERGTVVERKKDLIEIDQRHLYEPGPAKHALLGFLQYMEPDAVVFRREDGAPVSVKEMLDMLQRDDRLALDFLRDVTGAAVRAVRVKSKKPK